MTLARIKGNVCTYMHPDHLGSPIAGTDVDGNIAFTERYTPFGEALTNPAANDNQAGFTGHIKDKSTGLNYMQARYYDPNIGRFLSVDPVGFLETKDPSYFNRYRYCSNDPINCFDPTGMSDEHSFLRKVAEGLGAALPNVSGTEYHTDVGGGNKSNEMTDGNYDNTSAAKQEHYQRNQHNNPASNGEEALISMNGMTPEQSVFHQQGENGQDNLKFVSDDGLHEGVYDGAGALVTDPVNGGTYNFNDPISDPIGHVVNDVLPYIAWGNSALDPSTPMQRIGVAVGIGKGYTGDVNVNVPKRKPR